MAIAINSATPASKNFDTFSVRKALFYARSLAFTGNYITGGDILALNTFGIKSSSVPYFVTIISQGIHKYAYKYKQGTTTANGKVIIVDTTTGLELAAGAYPAAITGDTVQILAITLPMQ